MASVLYELKDCVVTDTGDVIVKYKHFVLDRLLAGKSIQGMKVERRSYAERVVTESFSELIDLPMSDVERYNSRGSDDQKIEIGDIDGIPEGPAAETFLFNIPGEYLEIDLVEYLVQRLSDKFPEGVPDLYVNRLTQELDIMHERQMDDFTRSLIYMIDTWESHNIVHGVGRGSACASLVLYLIGVHLVDPIEYEIPIDEFLR